MKAKLNFIANILKLVSCILIGIFVPVGFGWKLLCMFAANISIEVVNVLVCSGASYIQIKRKHRHNLKGLARKYEKETGISHIEPVSKHKRERIQKQYQKQISSGTQSKTMDNVPVETDSYVGVSLTQIVNMLDIVKMDSSVLSKIDKLYAEVDGISQRIMVTTNKQELMQLKQKLIPLQFELQDMLVSYIGQEHKSPKKKV